MLQPSSTMFYYVPGIVTKFTFIILFNLHNNPKMLLLNFREVKQVTQDPLDNK